MGLDMYLYGKKFIWGNFEHPETNRKEDGFEIKGVTLELGYWRKHPNLHGYIVNTFASGVDECQEIELDVDALKRILKAVEGDDLPFTEGFFFGKSDASDKKPTIKILKDAIKWLKTDNDLESRSVYYHASW